MRSHLTAFGLGAGLSLIAAGALAVFAPKLAAFGDEEDGVHVVNIGKGGNGSFHLKDETRDLAAEWKGDFEFAADGRSLTSLKKSLEILTKRDGDELKAVFTNADGAARAAYFKNDDEISGPDGAAGAADLLQRFARSSGVNAGGRVKAMLASGGKEAAIAEIGLLEGAHATGAYIEELSGQAKLTDDDVFLLTDRIKSLDSDYAKRSALSALLTAQQLSDAAVAGIIDVARTIEGDHEVRLIVEDLAEKEISARNFSIATQLIDEIEGDHEIRLAVSALLESENLRGADAARALDVAAKVIGGDHELRLVLEAADGRLEDDDVGAAGLRLIAAIEGAHERRLAIEEFADALDGPSPHWLPLIEAATRADSDHERRLTLEAIRGAAPETDEIRAALKKAAGSIASDHERRLALEAVE
jgi:hypothetical protein